MQDIEVTCNSVRLDAASNLDDAIVPDCTLCRLSVKSYRKPPQREDGVRPPGVLPGSQTGSALR